MRKLVIDKGWPTISYIVNNWPQTKNILKKFVLSNHKKPDLYNLSLVCLNELNVFKIKGYKSVLKKLSKICSQNFYFNTYHDQHHVNLNYKERLLLVIMAMTHDMNHQGRRVLGNKPYYQEYISYDGLEKILFKKILNFNEMLRIKRIFKSTYFLEKPKNVQNGIEKIILDSDILGSLMFGHEVGIKLARRLKQEIRYKEGSEMLFTNFLKLLNNRCLYLDYSKNSC